MSNPNSFATYCARESKYLEIDAAHLTGHETSFKTFIDYARDITRSLKKIKSILDMNPQFEYEYRDILENELFYLEREFIPYISGLTGELEVLSFDDSEKFYSFYDKEKEYTYSFTDYRIPSERLREWLLEDVKFGNLAIGQAYKVGDGSEVLSPALATEYSLVSTAKRWAENAKYLSEALL